MSDEILIQAKRAVVEPGVEIENVLVRIVDDVIVNVAENSAPTSTAVDLGDVTLVPGFVNAHTHLEFSDLAAPLGRPGMPFVDWLKLVIGQRIQAGGSEDLKAKAIEMGLAESLAAGVVAIGEIATAPIEMAKYRHNEIQFELFFERLTRNPDLAGKVAAECEEWLVGKPADGSERLMKAISPHAPYSVHPSLFEHLVQQSIDQRCPIAMHLAETREELQLLSSGDGPFVDFLESVSAWYPETYARGTRILDYLKVLTRAPRSLIVHGNFLDDEEVALIARQENMFVVFCPRTHEYFQHDEYPLAKYLEAGIQVVIGTDSCASNPDLSVFNELKAVRRRFPDCDDLAILKMATSAPSLGMRKDACFIKAGNSARFNVIEHSSSSSLFGDGASCLPFRQFL